MKRIEWLAGLLEGEGCFLGTITAPRIEVSMTDKDIICRAADIMDSTVQMKYPPSWKARGWSPQWRTRVFGDKARKVMIAIYPYMGNRRSLKIKTLIHQGVMVERLYE